MRIWSIMMFVILGSATALACTEAELEAKRDRMWAYAQRQNLESLHHSERWREWAFAVNLCKRRTASEDASF